MKKTFIMTAGLVLLSATSANASQTVDLHDLHPFWFSAGAIANSQDENEQNQQESLLLNNENPVYPISAGTMVDLMGIGWNLGNTLDAHPHGNQEYMGPDVPLDILETLWGNTVTTFENIETIYNAGFNTIRIPITWYNKLYDITLEDATIRGDWMDRVQQVVDYAVSLNMITIINTHHDERLISLFEEDLEQTKVTLVHLWEQIGERFADYDHFLIFEGMNEPRTIGSPAEWAGGTEEERNVLNILNQVFVDTVRGQGGNNPTRVLMVPTYAAAADPNAIDGFVLPTDTAENKLIVSIHAYTPWMFALYGGEDYWPTWSADEPEDTGPIHWAFGMLNDTFLSQGIPVVLGEAGALNRGHNTESRVAWTYYYTAAANALGMPVIWWDNGNWDGITADWSHPDYFAILDRETNTFPWPEIVQALLDGRGL